MGALGLEVTTWRMAASACSWMEGSPLGLPESWFSAKEGEKEVWSKLNKWLSSVANELPELLARIYRSRRVKGFTERSGRGEDGCSPDDGDPAVIDTSSPQFRPCSKNFYMKVSPLSNGCDWGASQ